MLRTISQLVALFSGLLFLTRPAFDPDLGFHLAGGNYITNQLISDASLGSLGFTSLVPAKDFINSFSNFWHDYHWLAQLIIYNLKEVGGFGLVYVVFSMLLGLTFLVLFKTALRITEDKIQPVVLLLLLLPAFFLILEVASIRPHIFSVLLIALANLHLLKSKPSKAELLLLFFYSVILVNIHIYWLFIPFLWLVYRVIPGFVNNSSCSVLYSWGGLFLLLAAGLVSPYSFYNNQINLANLSLNYSLILDYLFFDPALKASITEFGSPLSSLSFLSLSLVIFTLLLVRTFSWKSFSRNLAIFISALTGACLFLSATKYSSIFAVLALPAFILICKNNFNLKASKNTQYILAVLIFTFITCHFMTGVKRVVNLGTSLEQHLPISACRAIASAADSSAVILTSFDYGGWCRYVMYREKPELDLEVTTDGRTQGYPVELYKKSAKLYALKEGWQETLASWNPEFILAPREKALSHILPFFKQEYQQIYSGNKFAVFRKN